MISNEESAGVERSASSSNEGLWSPTVELGKRSFIAFLSVWRKVLRESKFNIRLVAIPFGVSAQFNDLSVDLSAVLDTCGTEVEDVLRWAPGLPSALKQGPGRSA